MAIQYATNKEAAEPLPIPSGREVVPSSSKAAPSIIVIQGAKKDAKGSKKRWKQHPQWVAATADYDDYDNNKAGNSDIQCITTTRHSVKSQSWPPTKLFERPLEEACPNHVYPIKHKLKDCGMMKNFMTSGSLTEDKEPEEDLGGREAMPFPREDAIIIVSDGCPPLERSRMSNLSPDTRTHYGREPRDIGV
jgi:hypothetical protein